MSFSMKRLRDSIGNNMINREDDVQEAKQALNRFGYCNRKVENGFINRKLVDGLKSFQEDFGLKKDGIMKPGGETERQIAELENAPENPGWKSRIERLK